jgi:Anti-sigma-K factor rskA
VATPTEPDEHERIEELLAGYALRSLSDEDAVDADRLLSEHVAGCDRCRATLLAFTDTAADLGLATTPLAPPDMLLPRLHRELEPRTGRPVGRWTGVAAGVVVVVAAGLALSQGMRALDLEQQNEQVNEVLNYFQRPGATSDRLEGAGTAGSAPMSEISAPDAGHFFLLGTDVPAPPPGTAYGIWLSDGLEVVFAGEFPWGPGVHVVKVPFDRSRFDRVLVTIEEAGAPPASPGPAVWEGAAA